jgi:uncharacterized repeat protein (TIGR01451 family)
MSKRLALTLAALAVALTTLAAMPLSASAASPWWQILDGSRPSNLWEPTDSVQEIKTAKVDFAGEEVLIAKVEVDGETVGCMAAGNFAPAEGAPAAFICAVVFGLPVIETAEQLQEALEGPYGAGEVEVTGGPAGGEPFIVTVEGRSVPSVQVSPVQPGEGAPFLGEAETTVLSVGGSGRLVVTVTNLGNKAVDASEEPVTVVDVLPQGVIASSAEGFAGARDVDGPVDCEVEDAGKQVTCTWEGEELPAYESIEIEIPVSLTAKPPVAGTSGTITVSGGGVAEKSASQEITVSPEETPFGIERFSAVAEEEGGAPATQAGAHPFQYTTTIQLNSGEFVQGVNRTESSVEQPAQPRNFRFTLPAGLVGNVRTLPQCALSDFYDGIRLLTNQCPDDTAIGVAATTLVEKSTVKFTRLAAPLFNLTPGVGEPARLGLTAGGVSVVIDTEVDPDDKYRIIGTVRNTTQLAQILSSTVTIWGTPGDPAHNGQRGWFCGYHFGEPLGKCTNPPGANEEAFLRLPVNCTDPLEAGVEVEPWNTPLGSAVSSSSFSSPALQGCAQVPFEPSVSAAPTNRQAGGPSGLDVELTMPNNGLLNKDAIAEGQAKKVEVTLPQGVTINPSQAEGLAACSPAQYAAETATSPAGAGCPEAAKVGSVQVSTPILEEEASGSVYVATPFDNPFGSLVALYIVAKIPERGILVKQAGKVELDPSTGQLTTTFDDLPQLPFESFKLHFNEGSRAPLVMPEQCGSYEMVTRFTPWSAEDPDNPTPDEVVTKTSPFAVDRGCPSGAPGFNPGFLAGTNNNSAGSYSPFTIRLTRSDDEQEFSRFSVKLPKGVIGKLAGVPFCPDAAIAAAKARTGSNGGQEELDSPSCPAASQIGRTLAGAGVGPDLTYVPGSLYLAGPYKGAKLSAVAITPAKVGPFDLGTIVIRQALRIDPTTAEVTTDGSASDPIPHILQGVVVHARDIRVLVDRDNFVLNPTSCQKMTANATVVSGAGATATPASPFQAADCASLGFKPSLSIQLLGGTTRTATPRLKAVVTARKGDANIGRAQVTLPPSEFLEQAHIRTVCTRVQFNAGAGNGAECPKASVYGKAKAISPLLDEPLSGPVFLRSSDNELPDMVAALHSSKVDIDLVGRIDSTKQGGIRSTFEGVPDAPVSKFVLQMQGGKKGLIVNSEDICKAKHRAKAAFKGQNGKRHEFNPVVKAKCGGKKKGGKGK